MLTCRSFSTLLLTLCLLGSAALCPPNVTADEDLGQKIYKNTLKGTVWILRPVDENRVATGSGVLVDPQKKIIITNYHVVGNSRQVAVFFPVYNKGEPDANRQTYFKMMAANRFIVGEVVMSNPMVDLALVRLKTLPSGVKPIPLARSSPKPADRVHSIGSPGAAGALWIYTPGSVRQVYKASIQSRGSDGDEVLDINAWMILTNSDTNEGDSGGPLVNDKGELVGITQGGSSRARGISMFIDIREVRALLTKAGIRPITGATVDKSDSDSGDAKTADNADGDADTGRANKPDPERARYQQLAKELTHAKFGDRETVLEKFQNTKGADYTQALAMAIPALPGSFRDKARVALAERLKRMTDRTLQEYLKSEELELRRAAIGAIKLKESKDLLKALVPMLLDKERDVADEAYDTLCRMTGVDLGRAPDRWKRHLERE